MSAVLLLGAGTGAGLALIVRGLRPRPPQLARMLAALQGPRGDDGEPSTTVRLLPWSSTSRVADSDLELADRTADAQALRRLAAALALGALPGAAIVLASVAGVSVGPTLPVVATAVLGVLGSAVPDIEVRAIARERREEFVHALSSFLDVTAVLLAGGAGTETALHAAAALGDSWPQQRLRAALDRCRLTGQTPWEVLADLGDRLEIGELSQLATSLQLAGEQGARVRVTLAARARALRASQLAAVEARAHTVTEQMSVPVALLAVAFMLFVGFPAVWVVVGAL